MPAYRLYLNVGLTKWIDMSTPTDASDAPDEIVFADSPFNDGSQTEAEQAGLRLLLDLTDLGNAERPLVTDYLKWGRVRIDDAPTIPLGVAVVGGGTGSGSYATSRSLTAMNQINSLLSGVSVPGAQVAGGQSVVFRRVDPAVALTGEGVTVETFPAGWSGPVLL
jgi:hypothetical protein